MLDSDRRMQEMFAKAEYVLQATDFENTCFGFNGIESLTGSKSTQGI